MLRIGNITPETNLLLAPLAGYTDLAFRLVIRTLGGIGIAYTDLISTRGLLRRTPGSMRLVDRDPADEPLGVQLYGSNADEMAAAAQWCEANGAVLIDINMGCPAEKVCRHDGGVALMRNPAAAVRLAAAVVRAVRIPVTVKMRLGWDADTVVAPQLAAALESEGVAAVTVHGRTGLQRFGGTVDQDGIARVVAAVRSIPVIGNGDVRTPADVRQMLDETGCAGVMIGRAAMRNPWIFREAAAFLAGRPSPPPPTVADRVAFMNAHFAQLLRLRGETQAVAIFRQRVSDYARNMGPVRLFREKVRAITSAADYHRLVAEFFSTAPET